MEYIICPNCKGDLALEVFRQDDAEIIEGCLTCQGCNNLYPIIKGIPRLLSPDLMPKLVSGYGAFLKTHYLTHQLKSRLKIYDTNEKIAKGFEFKGLRGQDYHYKRLNAPTVKFSLQCRIQAISQGIRKIFPSGVDTLLDLGSADGLLAGGISALLPGIKHIYALDMDGNLLQYNQFPAVQADVCRVPFGDNTFDVVTAAALIEHLSDPISFLQECHRVLKPGGALLLTCPAPFFDWLATCLGYLKYAGHLARYSLCDLRRMCVDVGLEVVLAQKFMLTPIHFPYHKRLESLFRAAGLSFLMLNQVLGCSKLNPK